MQRWRRWIKRATIGAFLLSVALSLTGAICQALAGAADRRNFPPPGQLVGVGGHRLHVRCSGEGRPTVVLETGALAMSSLWGWVEPQVAVHTRVCSYDRAGLGWSEPGPEPRDGLHIAKELRALLQIAGEEPPYVLVGHSFGGLLVLVYADQSPEDVAGLLLLDSSHPDQVARFEKVSGKPSYLGGLMVSSLPMVARLGILRLSMHYTGWFDELPSREAGEFKAFFVDASHQSAGKSEMDAWEETARQVRGARPLGNLPLVVISASGNEPPSLEQQVRFELHRELAALSTHGSHRILAGTTHGSLTTSRAHAAQVAEVIQGMVEAIRAQDKR